jgi:uncharacterized protein YbjT (DUF2867 family)
MRVVVFGASGGVGSRVLHRLSGTGHDVLGVVRRAEAADAVTATGATPVLADVVDADLGAVLDGADTVIWALGARFATDGPEGAVRIDGTGSQRANGAGTAAGVQRWVQVSSLMADRPAEGPPMLATFLAAKGAGDEAVAASPMAWTVVRPSGLSDEPGTGTVQAAAHLSPDDWGGGRSPMISRDDVAALVVAAALDGYAVRRAFDVVGGSTPLIDALTSL